MSLEELKQQRASTKKNITRIKNIVDASLRQSGRPLSGAEYKCRLGILESYFKQILSIQTDIERLDAEDGGRCDIEDLYITTKLVIQSQLAEDNNVSLSETTCVVQSTSKLPRLKLPTFDGKYSNYQNFITSFRQIIDREFNLTNIEKFNHLRNCLQGQALETVDAFQVTNENYPKALERFKVRYDNKTLIFLEGISSLFDLPAVTKSNGVQLRSLIDKASAIYGSLTSLGSDKQISQAMLIYIILQKSDEHTNKKWKESLDFQTLPSWEDCTKVLERHCQYLESLDSIHTSSVCAQGTSKLTAKSKGQPRGYTFSCSSISCQLCSSTGHKVSNCERFKSMNVTQRFETTKKIGLCINCLSKGHRVAHCPSTHRCKVCARQHHSLLHRASTTGEQTTTHSSMSQEAVVHTHVNKSPMDNVILATAKIFVRDASGSYRLGTALLDSCSQVNFISEEFSQRLLLPRNKQNIEIQSIGASSTNIKYKTTTNIRSQVTGFELPLTFCITSNIAYQPDPEIDISAWNIPNNIVLADDEFYVPKKINMLLGTETFFSLLSVGQIQLGPNLPILQKTLLGWVVSGRYQTGNTSLSKPSCLFTANESLHANLEMLWKLEEVTVKPETWTREQQSCDNLYNETTTRKPDGRIVVKLPFKDDPVCLGESYTTALRRFNAQERRLAKLPQLRTQYVEFMNEYERLGHMSVVDYPNLGQPHYYIPHHCVLKPTSTTTKLRVVFDASCQTTTQKSLNSIQMVGPTIQCELFILLFRFRLFRFALTADIVKMYRQVLMHEDDRKFQYILWRKSPTEDIRTYQLNTVTYGVASAPYLAIRSLLSLAEHHSDQFATGAKIVKSSFYVDDLLCGADTLVELSRIKQEVTQLLDLGKFELSKWHSNHYQFREDNSAKDLNIDASVTSTLGLQWNQNIDCFIFSFATKLGSTGRFTKRTILSIASSLFDPLGLLAPVVVTSKILLQEIWLLKLNWDESVPQNIACAWTNFVDGLSSLSSIKVNRYCFSKDMVSLQLHGFCDASIRAYGCAIYARVTKRSGTTIVNLLTARSRVAPIKKQTLPKLELCGALLLARLLAKITPIICNNNFTTFLWTDSQIVLHWLKMHSATLSTFVGNRVSEIQDLTKGAHWKYVPTHCNPADIASRGCTVEELANSIWYTGPTFLYETTDKWPRAKCGDIDREVVESEKRKSAFNTTVTTNYILEIVNQRSSYSSALRLIARMFRFVNNLRHRANVYETSTLSPQELHHALLCITWNIQQKYFANDIHLLQKERTANGPLRYLSPFLEYTEGFQILKVGGRLESADIPEERKHPILLPNKCDFVMHYVRHLHRKNYHAGPKALVSLMRLQFWVVNARDVARRIVRSCIHCVRYRPKLMNQVMGQLPVERLTPSRPFARCGIDFCGPTNVYLRIRGKTPYKAYIAIFVCLATKAVHIELVSDLSTDGFLAALKRMIGRRGLPTDIFCDNATNFVGACSKLAQLKSFLFKTENQDAIVRYCANEFVNFNFIPPRAPHFGGIWEAAVKSAKGHLNRSIINARLTFEELTTVLVEIEAVLNSRPIAPLSSDPNDYEALTPGHFIIGSALKALPERQLSTNISSIPKWHQITGIKQAFWNRWSHEYINELQTRSKWFTERQNINNNSMVIIQEDNLPPQKWHLGRVINCVPGRDSKVRVVDIQTSKGVIRRPIHKLAPLPV